jgi:hypothetical protein
VHCFLLEALVLKGLFHCMDIVCGGG